LNFIYFAEIPDHSRIERAQFRMKDYGLFFRPTRGTLICFDASKINHGTTENTGYKQYGVAVLVKPSVLKAGLKALQSMGFCKA
jgi:hypothetical protein